MPHAEISFLYRSPTPWEIIKGDDAAERGKICQVVKMSSGRVTFRHHRSKWELVVATVLVHRSHCWEGSCLYSSNRCSTTLWRMENGWENLPDKLLKCRLCQGPYADNNRLRVNHASLQSTSATIGWKKDHCHCKDYYPKLTRIKYKFGIKAPVFLLSTSQTMVCWFQSILRNENEGCS